MFVKKVGTSVRFEFGSRELGITLVDGTKTNYITDTDTFSAIRNHFRNKTHDQLMEEWSQVKQNAFTQSGIRPARLLSCLIFLEPTDDSVNTIYGLDENK